MSTLPGARQTVLVTAVPRGFVGANSVEVGAVVSPRLSYVADTARLGEFPYWVDWHLATPSWEVSFNKGVAGSWLPATVLSERSTEPLWPDLFPETTRVASYDGDPGPARTAFGYSYATLAAAVAEAYQATDLSATPLAQAVDRGLPTPKAGRNPTTDVTTAVAQYLGFWKPVGDMAPAKGQLLPDFHERLSLLADHPGLLEALGLVVRLRVALPSGAVKNTVRVRFVPPQTGIATQVVSPDTRVDLAGGRYAPAIRSTDGRYDDRLRLALQRDIYSVHSLDVDASVAQLISVVRGRQAPTTADPSVPSARGGGFTLAMTGRVEQLQDRLTKGRQTALGARSNPTAPPQVWAEDLIVGHHLQVGIGPADLPPESVSWYGLGHRHTEYTTENAQLSVVDEAPVTLVARRQDPADPTKLLVSDVLTRWDGWSLALPHPAHRQLLQADPTRTTVAAEPGRPGITSLDFATTLPEVAADGSDPRLPPLRYGRTYRFRGRAVDLTGGAPAWTDAPTTAPTTYWRWEAAASPLVLPPPGLSRTEDAVRVVVRSDPRGDLGAGARSSRVIAPARVSVDVGLKHGVFDRTDVRPDNGAYTRIRGMDAVLPPDETAAPFASGYPRPLGVRWLPDPMATDVHLDVENLGPREASFVPAGDPNPLGVDSLGNWSGLGLVLTALAAGATSSLSAVEQAGVAKRLRVGLRPGARSRVAVRTIPREQRAAEHGVVDLLPGSLSGKLDRLSRQGVPAVNPDRFVELVHAVKRPLRDPSVVSASADRPAGRQNPLIAATVAVEPETSGRLTVVASWSEWQDTGPALRTSPAWSAPVRLSTDRTALLDVDLAPVATPAAPKALLPAYEYAEQLVLPDLRRRDVSLQATATSRFVEEFRTVLAVTWTEDASGRYLDRPDDVDLESIVLNAARPRPDGTRDERRLGAGRDYEVAVHPHTGQRTLRLTRSFLNGPDSLTTVEGVEGSVLAAAERTQRVIVPSAVRPRPPELVHALPAWAEQGGELRPDGTCAASRGASLLRLYLERPWWSSGDGEQLAVVTAHDHQDAPDFLADTTLLSKAVTLYGLDPALTVTSTTGRTAPLTSGTVVSGLELTENLGTPDVVRATIAAHDVVYHAERDLYVAELAFPDKPAGTFVRLAVARYQPEVGAGVPHLSPLVTLDPVQLLPKRGLVVRNQGSRLRISVFGAVHAGQDPAQPPRLRVSLQRRVRTGAGADLGWDTIAHTEANAGGTTYPVVLLSRPPGLEGPNYRVLIEEVEVWQTPLGPNPAYEQTLISTAQAVADLVGERVTWVASTPLPTN